MKPNTSNNDEHDIVKQAMECLNNFNRKSTGYQLGLIEGYAKALKQALAKHFELSTISWVDWIKREIRKNA